MDLCQVAWGVVILLSLALALHVRAVRIWSDYEGGTVYLIWPGKKYRVVKEYLGKVESFPVPISTVVSPLQSTAQDAAKKRYKREQKKIFAKVKKMLAQSDGRVHDRLAELQAAFLASSGEGVAIDLGGVFQKANQIFGSKRELQSGENQKNKTPAKPKITIPDCVALLLGTRPTIQEGVFERILPLLPAEIEFRTAAKAILFEYLTPGTKVFENQRILVGRGWIDKFAREARVAPRACLEAIEWFRRAGVLRKQRLKGRTAEGEWLDFNLDPGDSTSDTGREIISVCDQAIRQIKEAGGRIRENLLPPL